jgi:anti-anti-sigma factor
MINIEKRNKVDIISFNVDKINALIADDLKNDIIRILDNTNPRVVLNLKGVRYIDSTGFGCFLSVYKAARNNYGSMKFACPEPAIVRLLETLNLNTIFEIFDDLEDCIKSFRV